MDFSAVDTIWVLLGAALVFFMQAGFAMVETGFTRAKNAGNIIMKNLLDFCIGTLVFWIFGFGLMFNGGEGGFIGMFDFGIQGDYSSIWSSIPKEAAIIFQTAFCATAATIVSGAMAERTKFISYCIYSLIISAFIYPISGHWIWGGGWLAELGFHDFAGSTAVHMVGGVAAFIGAKMLGPRLGKFDSNMKPKAIPGHSMTLGALGVFILWFCWFGFNGTSTVSMTGENIGIASSVFVTTNIAAATATIVAMIITWIKYKKPDVSMSLNGALAGLVAITAGCDMVDPLGAFFIGLIAGFVVVFGTEFVEKILKVDDPLGAVAVHGLCGATGTILTGFFSTSQGLFYGHGWYFLGVQVLGVVSVIGWVAVTMTLVFFIIKKTIGLRVSAEEEIKGLDICEHNLVSSYADFIQSVPQIAGTATPAPIAIKKKKGLANIVSAEAVATQEVASAIEVVDNRAESLDKQTKITKLVTIMNQSKFESLKSAMSSIGITGMTVTQVLGFGMQKGDKHYYRGAEVESTLLPKVKVEIVICKVPVDLAVATIKKAIYSGEVGDGKIFIYDVENVIKVRTSEEGFDALQDD